MSTVQSIYLVRHAQTALNAEGRLRGLADPQLDDVGIAEAERLAAVLAAKGAGIVISSPLQRARRTAEIIARAAGIPTEVDDRFNDRDYGPQTGRLKTEVEAEYGTVDNASGVEPTATVMERARPALDSVLDADPERDVIVVTHDALVRPLITAIAPALHPAAPTASWNLLQRSDGHWTVVATDQKPTP